MTIDPFTAASPIYREAIRHPHTTGAGFEIMSRRASEDRRWLWLFVIPVAVCVGCIIVGAFRG